MDTSGLRQALNSAKHASAVFSALVMTVASLAGCENRSTADVSQEPVPGQSEDAVRFGRSDNKLILNLGKVDSTFSGKRRVRFVNESAAEVAVDRFESSCDCTTVDGLPMLVPAGATQEIIVSTDVSREPNFKGSLAIGVELFGGDERCGIIEVLVTVE